MLTLAESVPSLPADFDAAAAAAENVAKTMGIQDDIPAQLVNIVSRLENFEQYLPMLETLAKSGEQVAVDVAQTLPPEFVAKVKSFFAKHFPNL